MPYYRFKQLEDFISFKNRMINQGTKNKENKVKSEQVKSQLSGLPTMKVEKMGFDEEALQRFLDGSN